MRFGNGDLTYEVLENWAKPPDGWDLMEIPGVAIDSKDRVFAFSRSEHAVVVFDREGDFLTSWGKGEFARPHGIYIGPDDSVYCIDDLGHKVAKYSPDGKLLMTIGPAGQPSDTGYIMNDFLSIKRGGPPFNQPTTLAVGPEGEIYVTDGYGNSRVHKFSPEGELMMSWGEPGSGPGQFRLPHGIRVTPDGTVYVGDRMNSRIQVFSSTGEYITEWNDVYQPNDFLLDSEGRMYVAEIGYRGNLPMPGPLPTLEDSFARVTIRNLKGEVLATLHASGKPAIRFDDSGEKAPRDEAARRAVGPGHFLTPHALCMDSHGDLYVGEVSATRAQAQGRNRHDFHIIQKFVRVKD
jgi:sugar lactone lactonase YvrE